MKMDRSMESIWKHTKTLEDEHPQGIQLPIGMNRSSSWAGHDLVQKDAKVRGQENGGSRYNQI